MDDRLTRPEKVEELIELVLADAERIGANMLELVEACDAVKAATSETMRIEGARIMGAEPSVKAS